MTAFVVQGPFEIPYETRKGGRVLLFDDFWSDNSEAQHFALKQGCYIFAMRNRGLTPIYVGKATKSFKQEVFNPANRHKYNNGFSDYGKGTPVIYLVVHPEQKGPTNAKRIAEIEDFLIQAGVVMNPDLQNVKGTQQPKWSIKGVIRSRSGKRRNAENDFRKLFGIEDDK